MVFVFGLAYLLLACPVAVRFAAGMNGMSGSALMEVSYLGLCLRYDGVLAARPGGELPHMTARYGRRDGRGERARRKRQTDSGRGEETLRRIRRYIALLNLSGCSGRTALDLRIGMGDAAATALTAGALRAALPGALAGFARQAQHAVAVEPEYARPCLVVCLRGIFSAPAGDIMFAAAKAAMNKKRKEGARWKSIPLKA